MSDERLIRIFIGYDPHETVAWHVLTHSILARATRPVSFVPLNLKNLGPLMWRERNALQSTEFSFSRFLTPYLAGKGTIRFPAGAAIPAALVTKIVKIRLMENAARGEG